MIKTSKGRLAFCTINTLVLTIAALSCIFPFINIIAMSFSKSSAVSAGLVTLWPVKPTLLAYGYLLQKAAFWKAFLLSGERVFLGGIINMFLTLTIAYPLSKEVSKFRFRTAYVWFFFFTTLFSGGLIPLYVLVYQLKLMDTIWALVLPSAVPVFNVVLMLNFYRQIPKELSEASSIDGCSHWRTLWMIYVPCSLPAVATLTLFTVVGHWNAWFDGLIFSNRTENYPLQSYLQTVIVGLDFTKNTSSASYEKIKELSDRTLKCSQIIIAMIPILAVYPALQKYFVSGIVLGSVKG